MYAYVVLKIIVGVVDDWDDVSFGRDYVEDGWLPFDDGRLSKQNGRKG